MKKLVVVRHGAYNEDLRLDELGQAQISGLAEKLKARVGGTTVRVLSSPLCRADESAEILASALGAPMGPAEMFDVLRRSEGFENILNLVRAHEAEAETLVLVGHEWLFAFPEFYAKNVLRLELCAPKLKFGEACILDCEKKNLAHVA